MGYNVHDVLKKGIAYSMLKLKNCEILIFGDDLKFLSFFKMKHWICKEFADF
jgi:hypothetical protein